MHEEYVAGNKVLAAAAEQKIATSSAEMEKASAKRAEAAERASRLRKGEDIPGGLRRFTRNDFEKMLREAGFSPKLLRRARQVNEISEVFGFEFLLEQILLAQERAECATTRRLHRGVETINALSPAELDALGAALAEGGDAEP
jgi:hypothetical protein